MFLLSKIHRSGSFEIRATNGRLYSRKMSNASILASNPMNGSAIKSGLKIFPGDLVFLIL
jgi:hypothetical protein